MLFVLGVGMVIGGVALCLQKGPGIPGRTRLQPVSARWAGGVLLAFFPLVILVRLFIDGWTELLIQLINWLLALSCLMSAFLILWSNTAPARAAPRQSGNHAIDHPGPSADATGENFFSDLEEDVVVRQPHQPRNPFSDFS